MICLTGDVHHSSLGTNDQRYLDPARDSEARIAAQYVKLAEQFGLKVTLYVTGKTLVEEWRDFQSVAASAAVELGGHTYGGLPQTRWKKLWYRLRGVRPPSHCRTQGSRRSQRRDMRRSVETIRRFTGRQVIAWRSHGLVYDRHTGPLLAEAGIRLISDEISVTRLRPVRTADGLLSHPINVLPDHDHLFHAHRDERFVAQARLRGYGTDAFGCQSYGVEAWGEIVQEQVTRIEAQDGVATVLMHPVCQFLADDLRTAAKLFEFFARHETVWASDLLNLGEAGSRALGG